MAKSLSLLFLRPKPMPFSPFQLLSPSPKSLNKFIIPSISLKLFSTTSTPYPFQYDLIINRPTHPPPAQTSIRPARVAESDADEPESPQTSNSEVGLDSWVENKLSMDKSKRKYYNKRRKRMYGSDSDSDISKKDEGFVELKPEVVQFRSLHKREEELYFYDAFAYPWEKDKHYKMVYQLEKKYFPDQCFDKAFLDANDPKFANSNGKGKMGKRGMRAEKRGEEDKRLVFFDEKKGEERVNSGKDDADRDVTERKVEEFFKCLKNVPGKNNEVGDGEPYLVRRSTELPPRWDGPHGTVLLVNKPKGELVDKGTFCSLNFAFKIQMK